VGVGSCCEMIPSLLCGAGTALVGQLRHVQPSLLRWVGNGTGTT
jgi:hypothetical protein